MSNLTSNEEFEKALESVVKMQILGDKPSRKSYLDVLNRFADKLSTSGDVGACITPSEDGLRNHLVLWPKYRPGWRHLMLSFAIQADGVHVFSRPSSTHGTVEEFREWLLRYASTEEFHHSLNLLREQAQEQVEARLEVEGSNDLLIPISAENQKRLCEFSSSDTTLIVELDDWEEIPDRTQIRKLRSAGVVLLVVEAKVSGRSLELKVARESE